MLRLENKVAIVTGASRGFGYAVAQRFVEEGAHVIICSRKERDVQEAADKLLKCRHSVGQIVAGWEIDLSNYYSARLLVNKTLDLFGTIDILVNNAGIYGAKGTVGVANVEEWVETININLTSVYRMCHYTLKHMKQMNYGRIINLSGGGATAPLPGLSAYAASKAAVVRLTETMAAECMGYNIGINAIAPGALNTRLLDEVLSAGESVVGKEFYEKAVKQKKNGGTPLKVGAELCVFLASDESKGISGKLISAPWDKWRELPEHVDELMTSDIYTLRRITAKERGKDWDVES